MRILHTADWHLGIDLHRMSLLEDQAYFFEQLKKIIIEKQVDVIIIAGDIYDTALASKDAIRLYDQMMSELCLTLRKEVIVIAGNHDSGERLSSLKDLVKPMGLHIFGRMEKEVAPLIIQDCAFYPIPFFHLETMRRIYQTNVKNLDEAFMMILKHAKSKAMQAKKHIAIAHTFCANAKVSESDRFANVGGADLVSSKVFCDMDYTALGHLHRKQQLQHHVYYSGSPLAYSFSEAQVDKAVIIYDTLTDEVEEVKLIPLHPLITLQGNFEQIQQIIQQGLQQQAYYKIELTDQSVQYEMMDYFKEQVDNLLQLSGKQATQSQNISIALDEMETMNDLDIVSHFFQDYYEESLDDEEIGWFLEASQHVEEVS